MAHPVNRFIGKVPRGVGLLGKAFHILDLFTAGQPAWAQSELVRETGLPRSTTSRLVRYLCDRGYLTYLEGKARYALGLAAVDLGQRAQSQFDLVDVCAPTLRRFSGETGETVILTGYQNGSGHVVCLEQIPSTQGGLRVFENVGAMFPLYAGASSKAVLAWLPDAELERVLRGPLTPINPAVPIDAEALRDDMAQTRRRGYALSHEETYPGVAGVAAAVRDLRGRPIGSIAIAGPIYRLDPAALARLGASLAAAVEALGTSDDVPAADRGTARKPSPSRSSAARQMERGGRRGR